MVIFYATNCWLLAALRSKISGRWPCSLVHTIKVKNSGLSFSLPGIPYHIMVSCPPNASLGKSQEVTSRASAITRLWGQGTDTLQQQNKREQPDWIRSWEDFLFRFLNSCQSKTAHMCLGKPQLCKPHAAFDNGSVTPSDPGEFFLVGCLFQLRLKFDCQRINCHEEYSLKISLESVSLLLSGTSTVPHDFCK